SNGLPTVIQRLGKVCQGCFQQGIWIWNGQVRVEDQVFQRGVGSSNTDTGKASGSLETKYKDKCHGLTFTQKWNTDNTLGTEICVENKMVEGVKVALDTTFVPNTGKKSGKLKTTYKRDYVHVGCSVDIDLSGPTVYGWAVVGYEGWLAGYQTAFDTAKNDGTEFGGSIYQKVTNKVETSVNLAWTAGSNNTRFGIAGRYQLDEKSSVAAKVNNASLIGIGYTHTLRPGVKLTLSGLIDGKNFTAGGHKLGLAFELEA
ncbi:hypothetical protein EK904_013998, partial [Melospiza melodia maxima]